MSARTKRSPIVLAAEALRLADDALADLPRSPRLSDLERQVAALRSMFHDDVLDILTPAQHRRLAEDATSLAGEILDLMSRATG